MGSDPIVFNALIVKSESAKFESTVPEDVYCGRTHTRATLWNGLRMLGMAWWRVDEGCRGKKD